MPYRRNYRRRNNRRRAPRYGYFGRAGNDATTALRMAGKALALINPEYKNIDANTTSSAVSTTPVITQISNVAQGDSRITRTGDSIKVSRIDVRYQAAMSSSATSSAFRIMLVLDTQTNGAIYSSGNLIQDTTATDAILSFNNLDNRARFRVLYDKQHYMSDNGNQWARGEIHITPKDMHLIYGGNSGDITDLNTKSLSLFSVLDEPTNVPALSIRSRVRFLDN